LVNIGPPKHYEAGDWLFIEDDTPELVSASDVEQD
jgi:hypothetical protein